MEKGVYRYRAWSVLGVNSRKAGSCDGGEFLLLAEVGSMCSVSMSGFEHRIHPYSLSPEDLDERASMWPCGKLNSSWMCAWDMFHYGHWVARNEQETRGKKDVAGWRCLNKLFQTIVWEKRQSYCLSTLDRDFSWWHARLCMLLVCSPSARSGSTFSLAVTISNWKVTTDSASQVMFKIKFWRLMTLVLPWLLPPHWIYLLYLSTECVVQTTGSRI